MLDALSSPLDRPNLDQRGADAVRQAILTGAIRPGTQLKEATLAESLTISRSTARAALQRLEIEGLVRQKPGSGWQVFSVSVKDALDLYALRGSMEGLAASEVARIGAPESFAAIQSRYDELIAAGEAQEMARVSTADHAFHLQIVKSSGNQRLIDQYSLVQQHVQLYVAAANRVRINFDSIVHDHDEMKNYILQGDALKAESAAREHSLEAGKMLAKQLPVA